MKYSFGLNEEYHKAVVDTSASSAQVLSKRNLLINKYTSTSSVTAFWKIIAKNELIELTLK